MTRKSLVAVLALIACLSLHGRAEAGFGPQIPLGQAGSLSLGLGFDSFRTDWEPARAGWDELRVDQDRVYLQLGHVFTNEWEGYLRLGQSRLKTSFAGQEFRDSGAGFMAVGISGRIVNTPGLAIGPVLQAGTGESFKATVGGNDLEIGGPSWLVAGILVQAGTESIAVYGAPIYYGARSKVKDLTAPADSSYSEKSSAGAFAGVRFSLPLGFRANLEVQHVSRTSFSLLVSRTF